MEDVFGLIGLLGLGGLTVGIVALIKGKLEWLRIHDRKSAGLLAGISFIWLAFASAVIPAPSTDGFREPDPKNAGETRSPSRATTPLALDRDQWDLIDAETIDLSGVSEPGASVSAHWAGGNTSAIADEQGHFRVAVGPMSESGSTRVNVTAKVDGKETASEFTTVNRTLSEARFKSTAQIIPYDQLIKDPDALVGTVVTYKGEIFQYDSRTTTSSMIISVTNKGYGFWTDEMHLLLDPSLGANADENDLIEVWGTVVGSYTYQTAMGGSNTLPQLLVRYLNVTSKR